MEFNPHTALEYARALARPRLVGSGEDEKVAQEIVAKLESFGYRVEREPFQFTRAFDLALAVEIGVGLILILFGSALPSVRAPVAVLLAALLITVPFLNRIVHQNSVGPLGERRPTIALGRRYQAANIVARPPHTQTGDKPHLYLMAHYDSKSQHLPIAVRMVLAVLFVLSTTAFACAALLPSVASDQFVTAIGIVALVSGLPLLSLNVANESPGAIDNASGAGLVLHLAECLVARPRLLDRFQLTVLITGAEEMAIMGSLYHAKRLREGLKGSPKSPDFGQNREIFDSEPRVFGQAQSKPPVTDDLYVLNLDGVGVDGRLCYAASAADPLAELAREAAKHLNIPLGRFYVAGALFDHLPFAGAGLPALSLVTIGRDSWAVHTPNDIADKLHLRGFEMAGKVALRMIEMITDPESTSPMRSG
jgi:hypothetical protein